MIAWRPSMETGGRLLDAQHRRLVEKVNALLAAVAAGEDRRTVEVALRDLGDYVVRHFSQDEDCAMRGDCAALEWNGAARAELIRIVAEFRARYERDGGAAPVADTLRADLTNWVARYIPGPEGATRPCVTSSQR